MQQYIIRTSLLVLAIGFSLQSHPQRFRPVPDSEAQGPKDGLTEQVFEVKLPPAVPIDSIAHFSYQGVRLGTFATDPNTGLRKKATLKKGVNKTFFEESENRLFPHRQSSYPLIGDFGKREE